MDWLSRELISVQADLRDERQLLQKLLLSIDAGMAYVDKDEIYQIVNPQYAKYYNRRPEDFLGKRLFSLIPDLENPYHLLMESAVQKRKPVSVRRVATSYTDGDLRRDTFKDCIFTPIIGKDGEVTGTLILSTDVTETVILEQKLAWQDSVVEGSLDAIVATDLDGTILSWNKSADRIYGFTEAEAIGQSIAITFPEDKRDEVTVSTAMASIGRGVGFHITDRIRKNGEHFKAGVTITPVRDGKSKIVGSSTIVRDLSEELEDTISAR